MAGGKPSINPNSGLKNFFGVQAPAAKPQGDVEMGFTDEQCSQSQENRSEEESKEPCKQSSYKP